MRVLGIDPGYDRLGVAVLEGDRAKHQLLVSDCIATDRRLPFPQRLAQALAQVEKIFDEYEPDACALERVFFSSNQKTAMHVAETRGALMWCAARRGCAIAEYTPQEIKQAVTGYGKSGKQGVTDMLSKLLTLPPKKRLDDEYDAIAIALTHMVSAIPTLSTRAVETP